MRARQEIFNWRPFLHRKIDLRLSYRFWRSICQIEVPREGGGKNYEQCLEAHALLDELQFLSRAKKNSTKCLVYCCHSEKHRRNAQMRNTALMDNEGLREAPRK